MSAADPPLHLDAQRPLDHGAGKVLHARLA